MKRLCQLPLLCLAALLPAAAPPAGPSSAEVARLIGRLGDDDFHVREAATARLMLAREPALPTLYKALGSADLEVRRRAGRIVAAIEARLYPELRLVGHTARVLRIRVSADGKRVLSGGGDKTVRLWDATTGKEIRKMIGHAWVVISVAFAPKGKAVSAGYDREMYLWDLDVGKKVGVFTGHTDKGYSIAYRDQARLAATCGFDRTIRLWDLETGKEVRKLIGRHHLTEPMPNLTVDFPGQENISLT